MNHNNNV